MLLRRYIGKQLAAYYGQSADSVVGGISEPLALSSLWGKWHWLRLYQRLYYQSQGQWLTPVELFQPWYSQCIANYIIETCDSEHRERDHLSSFKTTASIDIIELGGGRGTHARHVMDHLHTTRPDLYHKVASYRIIDASPSLHMLQQNNLREQSSHHAEKYQFTRQDLLDVAERRMCDDWDDVSPSDRLTIVVALEVLDNLPHDKIRLRGKQIDQAIVRRKATTTIGATSSNNLRMEEVFVPLDDPLIQRVLDVCPSFLQVPTRYTWIPTVFCGVLDHLHKIRPNLHVLLADFDWLPGPDTQDRPSSQRAYGEPLVTNMNDVDQPCYLSTASTIVQSSSTSSSSSSSSSTKSNNNKENLCDILFPTDFDKLADFVRAVVTPHNVEIQKQADFLQTYGPDQVAATKSWLTGFSPMMGDFGNCTVLTTRHSSERQHAAGYET